MLRSLAPTITAILLVLLIDFTAAGNTTCAGNMTQWYTNAVGETACEILLFLRFSDGPELNRCDISKTQTNMQPHLYVVFCSLFVQTKQNVKRST